VSRLKGKVVLVTGANSGMGLAAVNRFMAEGAQVVGLDLKIDKLPKGALGLQCDVTKEAQVKSAVEQTVKKFGALHVLYNNAGVFPSDDHSVVDTEEKVWDFVYAVNVKGIAWVCKYGIPELVKAKGGSVINVASFVALVGCSVPQDAYTASKGAVIALTKSLAVQFGPQGVRSNAICPGPIETPLLMDWLLKEPKEKAKRMNRIPMGRFGKTDDIVNLALYLASDESTWTNGAALVCDGGITSNYF
jgi:NAD(P)-dependent dehydrogenase (short-subunit alcohol dehydrogenase family)